MSSFEQDAYDECANGRGFVSMKHHSTIRWYNPQLEDFEWREVPRTDEQALEALGGSPPLPGLYPDLPRVARAGRLHRGGTHEGRRGGQGRMRRAGGRRPLGARLRDGAMQTSESVPPPHSDEYVFDAESFG